MEKVKDLDLYLLLGVDPDADETTIKKAYRKKALTCHPDKNPDNPKAAELFHQLSDALSVLTDEKAKKAYDNLLKAKKANELRNRQLDAERKKFKDDLEAREKAAFYRKSDEVLAGERLKAEIERLQKEGQRQLEEEQERLKNILVTEEEVQPQFSSSSQPQKLKLRWREKADFKYDSEGLKRIFCKYGEVGEVIIMQKEKGKFSALIEMKSGAKLASEIEKGFLENPFKKVELIEEKVQNQPQKSAPNLNFDNYEDLVMRQLRQEEERKRLIEEIKRQDAEEN